jgi:hypothetical protein
MIKTCFGNYAGINFLIMDIKGVYLFNYNMSFVPFISMFGLYVILSLLPGPKKEHHHHYVEHDKIIGEKKEK